MRVLQSRSLYSFGFEAAMDTNLTKSDEHEGPFLVIPVALALGLDQGFQPGSATGRLRDLPRLLTVL